MRKKLISGILALSVITGCTVGYASSFQLSSEEAVNTKSQGGVIRLDLKQGVYIHSNETHHSVGLSKVYIDKVDGSLVVVKDNSEAVMTTSVTPDESITARGVTVGLSGGGKVSKVFFYKEGRKLRLNRLRDYKLVASSVSNIWFLSITHN